ncbi:MAG TPA: EamA family transporter [Candidatus Elarobacter sp.]|nr:EamA family transporter [Dongiaceae bacterium]HZW53437.1 EamA family transporter [Candidatus Elarobacter sp.]
MAIASANAGGNPARQRAVVERGDAQANDPSHERRGMTPRGGALVYVALVALALVWGYTWVGIKIATEDASPYVVAGARLAIATVVLFAALALTGRSLRPAPLVPTVILGLLQTTGWTLLQTLAVSLAGAGKSAVLGYTMPFWTALLAWPFLGERIAGLRWVALALAAAGLAFVVAPLDARSFTADGLAVVAGISWAASAVYAKRLRKRHDVELLSLTAWQLLWGTVPLVVLMLVMPQHIRWTGSFLAAMAFISLGGGALGWFLWMFILSRLPAGVAGIASLATPVVGVLSAALQLHEIPSHGQLLGMALILIALVVNALPVSQPGPRAEPLAAENL